VDPSQPFRTGKALGDSTADFSPLPSLDLRNASLDSRNLDKDNANATAAANAFSSLRQLIDAGNHRLDPLLAAIADAARKLTGATGAALAMWKGGAMVCRARSGDSAPPLGAQLSASAGISGECLRSGKVQYCRDSENDSIVDVEVCRSLGVRSIAVLPIQGWRGVNGILEVFSGQAAAFSESHLQLLEQIALLAERARATQPHDASAALPKPATAVEWAQPSSLLPASDRVGDVVLALAPPERRSRTLLLGAIGLVAIMLLGLVIWLGWRGAGEADAKARAVAPNSARSFSASSGTTDAADQQEAYPQTGEARRPIENDPVWKQNPGGESIYVSLGKSSAGKPVKLVSKVDTVAGRKTVSDRQPLLTDVASEVASNGTITNAPGSRNAASLSGEALSAPPSLPADVNDSLPLRGVLSAMASVPRPSLPVSAGISGGQPIHRVAPVYPPQALQVHKQGTVVLTATVIEDGTVHDIKVVEGPEIFANSAVEALKQWRYQPFQLDGKPVKNEIRINVDFKFPSGVKR
jgi:TonB family protein